MVLWKNQNCGNLFFHFFKIFISWTTDYVSKLNIFGFPFTDAFFCDLNIFSWEFHTPKKKRTFFVAQKQVFFKKIFRFSAWIFFDKLAGKVKQNLCFFDRSGVCMPEGGLFKGITFVFLTGPPLMFWHGSADVDLGSWFC